MVALIKTLAFRGLEAIGVDVQVHLAPGQHAFSVVGLADKAIAESRERVRAALNVVGLSLPYDRITISLSPADLPKEGSHYDLAIALGLLVAMGVLKQDDVAGYYVVGELGLDGSCRPVSGALPAAMAALANGFGLICPAVNGPEATLSGIARPDAPGIVAAPHLLALLAHLNGTRLLPMPEPALPLIADPSPDLVDVRGQSEARLALEVAAAGGHNILFIGPPGAGKSMLASRLPSLLPPLTPQEALDINMISSFAAPSGLTRLSAERPFRAPHHSASMAALIGGGRTVRPGEVSLAHNGVLFLDELPEFPRQVLDALRQPIEAGEVHIARAAAHVTYPARFQLVAAMNPCRCGYANDPDRACKRLPACMQDYLGRVSGPMMDRFDIILQVPPVPLGDMLTAHNSEPSEKVAARVLAARKLQFGRQGKLNRDLGSTGFFAASHMSPGAQKLLDQIVMKNEISARGFVRLLRVARTIADIENSAMISEQSLAVAMNWRYRPAVRRP